MTDEENTHIAFCWYQPEQWKLLKQIVPESMDDTYEEWKKDATESINDLKQEGYIIKKVSINTKELVAWCTEKRIKPISSSRSEFAIYKLQSRIK